MTFDIVIRNGTVFDGTKLRDGVDVAIKDSRIIEVGQFNAGASKEIKAEGLIVSPGFIDVHTHTTIEQMRENNAANLIYQGVTTAITGNCGSFESPTSEKDILDIIQQMECSKPAINIGTLVGHNALRNIVLDGEKNRPATAQEIKKLVYLVEEALAAGAMGFSTGLMYSPGYFAQENEIFALLNAVAKKGRIYTTHLRDEGCNLIESVQESLAAAKKSGVRLQISHHKATGKDNFGAVNVTLDMISMARESMVDVATDVYVYNATSTVLSVLVPMVLLKKYGAPDRIPLISFCLKTQEEDGLQNLCGQGWKDVILISHKNKDYIGKSVAHIAGVEKPALAYLRLLKEDVCSKAVFMNIISNDDVREVLKSDFTMVASDGCLYDSTDRLLVHPRNYGNVSKFISEYIRPGILNIEDGLRKLTSLPADTFSLKGRGYIKKGYFADIVIFNLNDIKNRETYAEPHLLSEGVEYVICNGKMIYERGCLLRRAGMFIK
jgi:N-acyl-D-amino-acid deacylase